VAYFNYYPYKNASVILWSHWSEFEPGSSGMRVRPVIPVIVIVVYRGRGYFLSKQCGIFLTPGEQVLQVFETSLLLPGQIFVSAEHCSQRKENVVVILEYP
jgi:hypothetical protein